MNVSARVALRPFLDGTPAQLGRRRTMKVAFQSKARCNSFPVGATAVIGGSWTVVDLLNEARDLLGHENPQPALPDVQLRALRALVKELRARRRATTERPRPPTPASTTDARTAEAHGTAPAREPPSEEPAPARESPSEEPAPERVSRVTSDTAPPRHGTRHIPASTRRAVFDRDGARCAFRDDRGERCRETVGLEIHHRHAHALGGPPTIDNLELRCRAHNALAAEEDFGRTHMDRMRGVRDDAAPERGFVG